MTLIRNTHFWVILLLFAALTFLQYVEQLGILGTQPPSEHFGLTRHSLERIVFLIPIIYGGYIFGLKWGLTIAGGALAVMLPRAIFISNYPGDALLESLGVVVVGGLACLWTWTISRERERFRSALEDLESAHRLLQHYVRSARSHEKTLTVLNAISGELTKSLVLKDVLRTAVNMVMELMEVEAALVFSLDEDTQELVLIAHEGVSESFARAVDRMKVGEGFNGGVAASGKPVTVKDASSDPRLTRPEVKKMKIQSQLIVPITIRGRVRGTLCVAMRRPREFFPEEIDLLSAVAAQMGTAIENAYLFERARDTAERLMVSEKNYRELFENANDAIWVHDLAGNITAANKASEKLTGYSVQELTGMNAKLFLSDEGLNLAGTIRRKLMEKEPVTQPYEQNLLRKDGSVAAVMLTTSLVTDEKTPVAFHHIARDVTEEKRIKENLRHYVQQVTIAQEEERKRIARDFHDEIAQSLYALTRRIDNYTRSSPHLTSVDNEFLAQLRNQTEAALQGVRRSSHALRPPMLDDLGLLATLRWLVGDLSRLSGIQAELVVTGTERRLTPEAEVTVFRIVQEALRNVEKHASATSISVKVEFAGTKLRVSISDNGKGFNLNEKLAELPRTGKLGLVGMEERIKLLGGTLEVRSSPDAGTVIIAEAPV
ncbi:MAG: PAS domain S-box protein [Dehalococcoidia bacterium]|nr:PAS domain S-box protein [Dehalococcoidia bacterium]